MHARLLVPPPPAAASRRRRPPAAPIRHTPAPSLPSPPGQVEFPDGRCTLCMLPAKFHKKLWIKKGNFLMVEEAAEARGAEGSRVTGHILTVLFADHVKQLKRMPGVWCVPECERARRQHACVCLNVCCHVCFAATAAAAGGRWAVDAQHAAPPPAGLPSLMPAAAVVSQQQQQQRRQQKQQRRPNS